MLLKSILIWLAIIPMAILNGGLRQRILEPLFGLKIANPISGLILCILIFIISFIFIPRLGIGDIRTYLIMGVLWIFLTIVFETIFGLFMGNTFKEIINAYNRVVRKPRTSGSKFQNNFHLKTALLNGL